jgi:type III secretion protein J
MKNIHSAAFGVRLQLILVFLALLLALTACSESAVLLTDIPEAEGNDALSALIDAGIKAQKIPGKDGMVNISVEPAAIAKAISVLHSQGLPRDRFATMGDVFKKEGMISSPLEERARYLWALSQELSATLSQIDGVIVARVQVVLPERSSGGDPALPSSASVFIKYRNGYQLEDSIPQIKRLVTNSIPALTEEKVSVVLLPSVLRPEAQESSAVSEVTHSPAPVQKSSVWMKFADVAVALFVLFGGAYLVWSLQMRRRKGKALPHEPIEPGGLMP